MKTFLLGAFLLVLGAVAVSSISKAELEEIEITCMRKSKVSGQSLVESLQLDPENVKPEVKCALDCFFEGLGLFDHDTNEYLHEAAEKLYPKTAEAPCKGIKDADRCETAYLIFKCYLENNVY